MTAAVMARVETANQVAVTSYVVPEVCATGVKVHVVATVCGAGFVNVMVPRQVPAMLLEGEGVPGSAPPPPHAEPTREDDECADASHGILTFVSPLPRSIL
jgi:hypothetical protein